VNNEAERFGQRKIDMALSAQERAWYEKQIVGLDAGRGLVTLAAGNYVVYSDRFRFGESRHRKGDPEELVRAVTVLLLCGEEYGYEPERLFLEETFTIGRGQTSGAQVDIVVYFAEEDGAETAFAMIELKQPSEYKPASDPFIRGQLFNTAKQLNPTLLTYGTVLPSGDAVFECITIDYTTYKDFDNWDSEGRPTT